MSAATSKDVARLAGVSQSTVSYVMSGKRPISEETRRAVEEAIAQLAYQPHAGARALAGSRTQVIAVTVPFGPAIDTGGLMTFTEELAITARTRDYDILLVSADEGPDGLRRLAGRKLCDAVVLMQVAVNDHRLPVARALGIPVVLIGVPQDPGGLHCVDFDFAAGAAAFVDDVADRGHRHLAVMGWSPVQVREDPNYAHRFRVGLQSAAARRAVHVSWHLVADGPAGADEAVGAALSAAPVVPSFVLPRAQRLTDVLAALHSRDLRPGVDVDVLALCTDAEAEAHPVPVSHVSPQRREVCRLAMSTLFRMLDRAPATGPAVQLVPPVLTHRATTAPPG